MTTPGSIAGISGPVGHVLDDIAHMLESAQDAEQRVRRVLDLLGRLVPNQGCALLVARSAGQPRFVFQPEPGEGEQAGLRARLKSLFELLDDHAADQSDLWPGRAGLTPWQSHLAVPLIGLDRVLGVLAIGGDTPDAYGDEDLSLLSVVASLLGAYLAMLQARKRENAHAETAARALDTRAHQWAVVAELGQRALTGADLQALLDETVSRVAQCLDLEYAAVLELLPDGKDLLLRAGIGWREGLIGLAKVGAGAKSQAGYTLLANEPVIVEDLRRETRFSGPPLLHDHGVVSGVSVVIPGPRRPFGVLAGYTSRRRAFAPDDTSFLQAVANTLSTVVERKLGEQRERFLAEVSGVLAGSIDYQTTLTSVAHLAVPYLADWCAVDCVGSDGGAQRLAVAGVEPAEVELGHTSTIAVPLVARGRRIGAISFATAESGHYHDATGLALVREFAHRAAVAIDNARLHGDLQSQMEIHVRLNEERDALRRVAEERVAALEELDRVKEEFIATASHDLKGPLTSIRGYSQMMLRRLRTSAPDLEQVAQGLAVIERQGAAMTRLLDDLLDAARIQAGALEPRRAPCDLGECLDTVLARLSPGERERVEVRLPDAPVAGGWEQKRIEQVLSNLVGNALKYSPDGERVAVSVDRGSEVIEVAVSDLGMGIPPKELPHLFERFHRTPQARASGLSGTGLGLYICRGIVEAHGGRIWAASAGEGRGATFRFALPLEPPEPSASRHPGKSGRRSDDDRRQHRGA